MGRVKQPRDQSDSYIGPWKGVNIFFDWGAPHVILHALLTSLIHTDRGVGYLSALASAAFRSDLYCRDHAATLSSLGQYVHNVGYLVA